MYHVTKHYPHSLGLSVAFAQPNANTHCRFPHGYALAFTFEFCTHKLDKNNWVIDFGKLKPLREWLNQNFDHKFIIATNDPFREDYESIAERDGMSLIVRPTVGMESFAHWAFKRCEALLQDMGESPRVRLTKVTVAEHEGNSASYSEPL